MPKRFRRQRTVGQRGQRDHFGPLLAELQQLNKVLADVNSKFSAGAKEDPDKEISIKDKKVDDTPLHVRRCYLSAYLGENDLPIEWQVEWSAPTWCRLITSLDFRDYNRTTFPSMTYRQGQSTYKIPWLVIQEQNWNWFRSRPKNPDHCGGGTTEPERSFLAWPKASELGTRDIGHEELNRLVGEDRGRGLFWWHKALFDNVDFHCYQYSYDEKKKPAGEDDTISYRNCRYIPELKHNLNERIKKYGISSDIYRRIWNLKFKGPLSSISKEVLTFITAQTEPIWSINGAWVCGYWWEYPNVALTYAAPWPKTRVKYGQSRDQFLLIQYHIRFLKALYTPIHSSRPGSLAPENEGGLELSRSVWQEDTAFLTSEEKLSLREVRYSIALNTDFHHEDPLFTIVTLHDHELDDSWDRSLFSRHESDIQGSGMAAGISAFQYMVSKFLETWYDGWNNTLDYIDKIRTVEVGDALSKCWIMDNLFDDSFNMSARYLAILQLLRVFTVWIAETDGDVDTLCSQVLSSICFVLERGDGLGTLKTRNLIRKNFEIIAGEKKKLVGQLLERVKGKVSEIESLRDGIFNASNLREAGKSSEMNSYLFIFTVMTIFYLPLSFVTSLFGMHLFDKPNPSSNQTSFYIAIVLASVITYLAALYAVWAVAPDEQRKKVKERWRRTVEQRRQKVNEHQNSSYTSEKQQEHV